MSRDRLLSESANIPLINAEGKVFDTFSDLPKPVQKFFRDTFRYPIKRTLEQTTHQDESALMELDTEGVPININPPEKKAKVTRGKAAAATRSSGRLATKKKDT